MIKYRNILIPLGNSIHEALMYSSLFSRCTRFLSNGNKLQYRFLIWFFNAASQSPETSANHGTLYSEVQFCHERKQVGILHYFYPFGPSCHVHNLVYLVMGELVPNANIRHKSCHDVNPLF